MVNCGVTISSLRSTSQSCKLGSETTSGAVLSVLCACVLLTAQQSLHQARHRRTLDRTRIGHTVRLTDGMRAQHWDQFFVEPCGRKPAQVTPKPCELQCERMSTPESSHA
jgi:hypothetical protein